ncbi:4Fe-4S ferredoxin [Neobacillus sp. 179-J 1A1 HS]|uniref:ferredoxin family protein n=1 Tax=Neobacillus driksii TaxID=3035913 RepID=UPI0035BC1D99
MDITEKLLRVNFSTDETPHIKVNTSICDTTCSMKVCLNICPAERFTLESEKLRFVVDGCLECGACRISCDTGAVSWSYPRGGAGVRFRLG